MVAGMLAVLLMAQGATVHPPGPDPRATGTSRAPVTPWCSATPARWTPTPSRPRSSPAPKRSGDVKTFATLLLHDHQVSLANNDSLANRFQIKRLLPDDSTMARMHREGMTKLNVLSGAAFDKAFMQLVVADHKAALAKINGTRCWVRPRGRR